MKSTESERDGEGGPRTNREPSGPQAAHICMKSKLGSLGVLLVAWCLLSGFHCSGGCGGFNFGHFGGFHCGGGLHGGGSLNIGSGGGGGSRRARSERVEQRQAPTPLSVENVAGMCRAGHPETLIISEIQAYGIDRPLTSDDMVLLKQAGASDGILKAMIEAEVKAPGPPR